MPDRQTLHFAFGSPQRFIAQARRTRDLWVGSYLLSWLCGRAMVALTETDPAVEFLLPHVEDDPLFAQIRSPNADIDVSHPAAHLGSLPTRFSARLSEDADPDACGRACQAAVNEAWQSLTQAVFRIVSSRCEAEQEGIWQRQTQGFWPCYWVVGDDPGLLEARKALGAPLPPDEPGLKCTLCGERQELSGEPGRPAAATGWWERLREATPIHDLDLRPRERLCAVCLVKRLFPMVSRQAPGWQAPRFYPSTAYVAAIDWLKQILDLAGEDSAIEQAIEALIEALPAPIVRKEEARNWSPIRSISERLDRLPDRLRPLQAMSGSAFFEETLRNDDLKIEDRDRDKAIASLKALQASVDEALGEGVEHARATPFYALLMMDGDGMGDLFARYPLEQQRALARALGRFNRQLPEILRRHDGWLIYAAGEDVFALLPVGRAMECAHQVRWAYRQALLQEAPFVPDALATISAAINFAHITTALGTLVRDTHGSLLDGTAKDGIGRDAIACRIWKRGGPILTWAQPWGLSCEGLLPVVVRKYYADGAFSTGFFYKLHALFEMHQGAGGPFTDAQLRELLIAEYLANRDLDGETDPAAAGFLVDLLMALCRRWRRQITSEGAALFTPAGFDDAGARLARFLQQKEV